jgi:hypothetical protein
MPCPIRRTPSVSAHPSQPGLRTSDVTAEPAPTTDVLTVDRSPAGVPATRRGRHVADGTTMLSIQSFVGGRYPRHRVDADLEFAAFPDLGDGR